MTLIHTQRSQTTHFLLAEGRTSCPQCLVHGSETCWDLTAGQKGFAKKLPANTVHAGRLKRAGHNVYTGG